MIPAMPPLIILGKSENCCTLATPELVVLELNADDDEDEEDIFAVEMVTTEGFGDDVTPAVVVASLDFIADSLRQPVTAAADCCVAQAKAHFCVARRKAHYVRLKPVSMNGHRRRQLLIPIWLAPFFKRL